VNITWHQKDKVKDMWVVYSTEGRDALTAAAMSGKKQLNLTKGLITGGLLRGLRRR
jgi:hypothetical protein